MSRGLKWVLITGTTLLVLLFVALFGLKAWLNRYLKSEAFENSVAAKIEEFLKSEIELEAFSWEGQSVYADGFRSRGYEDAGQSRLDLDGFRAAFGGIADQAWQIPEATVNRMTIEYSPERLEGDFADRPGVEKSSAGPAVPGWLQGFVPKHFEIGEIRIDSGNLHVRDNNSAETFAMHSVQTRLNPIAGSRGLEIGGRRGELVIPGQPEIRIDRFFIRWQGEELFIDDASVDVYDDTHIDGTGVVVFPESGGSELDLRLKVANLAVSEVIGPDWKDKLSGIIHGNVNFKGKPGSSEPLTQTGTLNLREGELKALPILDKIAKYTRTDRFKRLTLSTASADFERKGDLIRISNLAVESSGLTRVEGTVVINGRALEGDLRIGVTPGTMRWIPGAERKIFVKAENGFLWTGVRVAGTLDNPREDLSSRLVAAAAQTIVEEAPQKAIDTAREAIESPTEAPSKVIDEGRKLLDTLVPLLPTP